MRFFEIFEPVKTLAIHHVIYCDPRKGACTSDMRLLPALIKMSSGRPVSVPIHCRNKPL